MKNEQDIIRGTILNVPFPEKDKAKQLGARWDPEIKRWFIPLGVDPAPFAEWIPQSESAS